MPLRLVWMGRLAMSDGGAIGDRDTVLTLAVLARAEHGRPGERCGFCLAKQGVDPADTPAPDPHGCDARQRLDATIAQLRAMPPSGGVDPQVAAILRRTQTA
jgi:hypothetical protein